MTLNQLASKIAKLEGKKSQARIGDIREILSILSDVIYISDGGLDLYCDLYSSGMKRFEKKRAAKKAAPKKK